MEKGTMWYIQTVDSATKRNKGMIRAAIWMNLEDIMLSEITDTKDKYIWFHLCEVPYRSQIQNKRHKVVW